MRLSESVCSEHMSVCAHEYVCMYVWLSVCVDERVSVHGGEGHSMQNIMVDFSLWSHSLRPISGVAVFWNSKLGQVN